MAGDIEDFLRRAAQRRAPQGPPPVSRPVPFPPDLEILDDDDVVDTEIVDAYPVEDPGILSGPDVGAHVSQHINTADFGERISHLGEVIDHADDRMEAHMQEIFEHKLGELGAPTSRASESTLDDDGERRPGAAGPGQRAAFNIRRLLSSPGSIRDAIVLGEVLRRPDDL